MREVAVVSYAQFATRREDRRNEVEMLLPVLREALEPTGLSTQEIGFTVSGSSDYLAGQAFAFVSALDAVGPWPPIAESHVEMDGAFALYEAWVRLQHGDIDTALVYAFGRSSPGDVARVLCLQLDPYLVAPLWPDAVSLAALQARALLDTGGADDKDLARVVARSRRNAQGNPHAQLAGDADEGQLLDQPLYADPLRKHDCPPVSDGAAVVVLAAGDRARELCERPAWIRGIDHRIEAQHVGARDLTTSSSTALAARKAGLEPSSVDLAELHAPFSHQEIVLTRALGLDEDRTSINPSGGALASNPVMAAGLVRIGEAAQRLMDGEGERAVAHATSGPCLQQNLLCVLEGDQ
ncbi:MAG TPA: thiolase domain-containing protein [Mycobacteriales bacterium]|nr:thiolase domain-containing protein [Mycobacteriales bacterium]